MSDYVSIIGLLATLAAAAFAAPPFFEWLAKYKPTLYLVIDNDIKLLKDISRSSNDLKITYKDRPLEDNSFLLKAYICYMGKDDISKDKIIKSPVLILPDESVIHNCEVLSVSNDDMQIVPNIKGNKVEFGLDIMKNKELFYFEVLSEVREISDMNRYRLGSRIVNVNNYSTVDYNLIDRGTISNAINIIMVCVFATMAISRFGPPVEINANMNQYDKLIYYKGKEINLDKSFENIDSLSRRLDLVRNSKISVTERELDDILTNLEIDRKIMNAHLKALSTLKYELSRPIDYFNWELYWKNPLTGRKFALNEDFAVEFKLRSTLEVVSLWMAMIVSTSLLIYLFVKQRKYAKVKNIVSVVAEYKRKNNKVKS